MWLNVKFTEVIGNLCSPRCWREYKIVLAHTSANCSVNSPLLLRQCSAKPHACKCLLQCLERQPLQTHSAVAVCVTVRTTMSLFHCGGLCLCILLFVQPLYARRKHKKRASLHRSIKAPVLTNASGNFKAETASELRSHKSDAHISLCTL
jgi:hypothetical protein